MSINTPEQNTTDFSIEQPDARGHFGIFGGRFVSETLTAALDELQETYEKLRNDPEFQAAFDSDLAHYVGRPSPLYFAERLTDHCGGAKIYLASGCSMLKSVVFCSGVLIDTVHLIHKCFDLAR